MQAEKDKLIDAIPDPQTIVARLQELDRESKTLRALLRAAKAREREFRARTAEER